MICERRVSWAGRRGKKLSAVCDAALCFSPPASASGWMRGTAAAPATSTSHTPQLLGELLGGHATAHRVQQDGRANEPRAGSWSRPAYIIADVCVIA